MSSPNSYRRCVAQASKPISPILVYYANWSSVISVQDRLWVWVSDAPRLIKHVIVLVMWRDINRRHVTCYGSLFNWRSQPESRLGNYCSYPQSCTNHDFLLWQCQTRLIGKESLTGAVHSWCHQPVWGRWWRRVDVHMWPHRCVKGPTEGPATHLTSTVEEEEEEEEEKGGKGVREIRKA